MGESLSIWREIFEERAEQERWLLRKHPWYPIVMNWIGAALLAVLLVASVVCAIQANTRHRAEEMAAAAVAEWEAGQAAAAQSAADEEARARQALDAVMDQEAEAIAKLFFGIRMFQEKYGYDETDLRTYARSAFNRADATGRDLMAVVFEEGQYVACSEHNTVLSEYKKLARELVEEWHSETSKPCDTGYQYAELLPQGIFLKTAVDGKRWRA